MSLPNISQVISQYLYGSTSLPGDFSSETLIRADNVDTDIQVQVIDYMTGPDGPGRFALASNIDLISTFMTFDVAEANEVFTSFYSGDGTDRVELNKSEIASFLGFSSYGLSVDQKDWNDGVGNYGERVFIWGNTAFQINNDAKFVIEKNNAPGASHPYTMRLENFYLEPRRENQGQGSYDPENFDFKSSDGSTELTQETSERAIDPSGIGRTVELVFKEGGLTAKTYTYTDYLADQQMTDQYYSVFEYSFDNQSLLKDEIQDLFDDLFEDGITSTTLSDKMIVYGTSGSDDLHSYTTTRGYDVTDETADIGAVWPLVYTFDLPQHNKTTNGIVYVAGGGHDTVIGTDKQDALFGGTGGDTLIGGVAGSQLGGQNVSDVFFQNTPSYFDDEIQDRLEGGEGLDSYLFYQRLDVVEDQRNWETPGSASGGYSFFDVILTSYVDVGRDPQKFDLSLYQNVDVISDSDGNGQIFSKSLSYDHDGQTATKDHRVDEFSNLIYTAKSTHGLDYYTAGGNILYLDSSTSKLYGFVFYTGSEFGGDISAHWSGYHAAFAVENFSWGDFNIYATLPAINGTSGNDAPDLQAGPGGEGADYSGGDGDDIIIGTAASDSLKGENDNDTLDGGAGDDQLSGGRGDDVVSGGEGSDILDGGRDNDVLDGGVGDDQVFGGLGDDQVSGGAGNDVLVGGIGDDILDGGIGSDTYKFEYDTGSDTISDAGLSSDFDILEIYYLLEEDVILSKVGANLTDLLITDTWTGQTLLVEGQFALGNTTAIEKIVFLNDGAADDYVATTSWDVQAIESRALADMNNTLPVVVTPIASQSLPVNTPWSYTVPADTFFDADGDTLFIQPTLADGSLLPFWMSFDQSTNTISGTPPVDFNGSIGITVAAYDRQGAAETTFTLLVGDTNDAPIVATAIADQAVLEDTAWSYAVSAGTFADADGDVLTYSASLANGDPLPSWLSFDGATQAFSGTPPQDFNGTISLKVIASDGSETAETSFTLTVSPENDAPVVAAAILDQSAAEDTAWSFAVPAGTFIDADGDALSYSAALADGSALPSWLSFDDATQAFSGTPPQDFNGTLLLKVTASDGTGTVDANFTLTVVAENDAPVVTALISDQSTTEDTAWSFAVPAGTFTDADGDALSYSAALADGSDLPSWMSFDDATQTFSGTPPQDFNGTISLKVIASDGSETAEASFTLTISPENDAPVVAAAILDQSTAEDTAWSFAVPAGTFTDADGDALIYSAALADGSALPSWLNFDDATQAFSGTPPQDFNGTLSLKVIVSDGTATAESVFELIVTPADTDVGDTIATASSIAVGGSITGTVDVAGDHDWYAVELEAGVSYQFSLRGAATSGGTLSDPFLALFDAAGVEIDFNDDHDGSLDALIEFTPTTSGTYYLDAEARGADTNIGTYTLEVEVVVSGPTDSNDTLSGTSGADLIDGLAGDDAISGLAGDDTLIGGAGADSIDGGDGNDTIHADAADTWFDGGNGVDTLIYDGTDDRQYAMNQGSFENMSAGSGNNTIWGTADGNLIDGEGGNDVIHGYGGNDTLIGGSGSDSLMGGDGDDTVYGDADDVWFSGDDGEDTLIFTSTADFDYALDNGGFEHMKAGSGDNAIYGTAGDNILDGEAGDDFIQAYDGNDTLIGGSGSDSLQGGDGDDIVFADADDSWFSGDAGIDTLIYTSTDDRQYSLGQGAFEHVEMGGGNNVVWGSAADNTINGQAGADTLYGYAGADRLIGGTGADHLVGGDGDDAFVFSFGDTGHDTITDFVAGAGSDDEIEFESGVFSDLASVLAAASDDGTDTTITIDAETSVLIQNVVVSNLHQDDFRFV
ncbi:putative Ig domain-containing protein [Roseibium polysiphoniae]|uniref:Tandem-95 repeat protein n=1 Tax=Roseibium polysiphoniae TaxID=2571221 RepID=A0ABR9C8F5_9HYPH|nr:putative Ig domain-containing protein [Roseibium polysiphoniae]MBD8876179.1 tandem-95 repeat protein [Roseibium polysiphoniae]